MNNPFWRYIDFFSGHRKSPDRLYPLGIGLLWCILFFLIGSTSAFSQEQFKKLPRPTSSDSSIDVTARKHYECSPKALTIRLPKKLRNQLTLQLIKKDTTLPTTVFDTIAITPKKKLSINKESFEQLIITHDTTSLTFTPDDFQTSDTLPGKFKTVSNAIGRYVGGELVYQNWYNERAMPNTGMPIGLSNQVSFHSSFTKSGLPVILSVGYNDIPNSINRAYFNIKLDTKGVENLLAYPDFKNPSQLKDSLFKHTFLQDQLKNKLTGERDSLFNKYAPDQKPNLSGKSLPSSDSLFDPSSISDKSSDKKRFGLFKRKPKASSKPIAGPDFYTSDKQRVQNLPLDKKNWKLKDRIRYKKLTKNIDQVEKENQDRKTLLLSDSLLNRSFQQLKAKKASPFGQKQNALQYFKNFKSLEAGRIYPSYSRTTIDNISLNGIMGAYHLGSSLTVSGYMGKSPVNSFNKLEQSMGSSIEYSGLNYNTIHVSYIRNRSKASFQGAETPNPNFNNEILELGDEITLGKYMSIQLAVAVSMDRFETSFQDALKQEVFNGHMAYRSTLKIKPAKTTQIRLGWLNTDRSFNNLSNPFIWSGINAIILGVDQLLFNRKLSIKGEYQHSIRKNDLQHNRTKKMFVFKLNTRFRKLPNFFLQTSPITNELDITITPNQTIDYSQRYITFIAGMFHEKKWDKVSINYGANYNAIQGYNSENVRLSNFENLSAQLGFLFNKLDWSHNFALFRYDTDQGYNYDQTIGYQFNAFRLASINSFQESQQFHGFTSQIEFNLNKSKLPINLSVKGGLQFFNGTASAIGSTMLTYRLF